MGTVLRRYWHPIATSTELEQEPVLAVRLLGEDLALYNAESGEFGLVAQRCPPSWPARSVGSSGARTPPGGPGGSGGLG
jgi:hypothetical protein